MVDHFKGLQNFSLKDKNVIKYKDKYIGNYNLIKEVINFFNFKKIRIFSNDILNFDFNILKKNKFSLVLLMLIYTNQQKKFWTIFMN